MVLGKKGFYLLQKLIPIGVEGQERVVEVPLKDAVGAIHRTVGQGINDVISATDVVGSSRTGFQPLSVKTGDEEIPLP